jgi:tetratricopeptide (TPR) repeat protein
MRLFMAAGFVAILACTATTACAQSPTVADEQAAKAHFMAGSAYYDQANYADAVKEFNEAHRLSKRPDLLYNISVCYERLGRWDDAIGALRQYLVERPDATDRAVIESRIANFTERRDAEQNRAPPPQQQPIAPYPAPPPPSATVTTTRPARPRARHVNSWIVGGIGAGLLVGALATGVTAQLTWSDVNGKCPKMVCNGADQNLRNEVSLGRSLTISTDTLIALGAAGVATGVILFILEARRPATRAWLVPSASGIAVQF